jgi:FkbM family methyltransferase
MKVFFDVGAHDGTDGFNALKHGYDKCYAFEIDKRMISKIKNTKTNISKNYILTEKAVGSVAGKGIFKSFKKTNVGSLHNVNPYVIIGREAHFDMIEEYEVEIITLADFCIEHAIEKIDYLHIDTQGNDLEVIKGLKDYIHIVDSGRLECYDDSQENLYVNTSNTLKNCKEYLEAAGFQCEFIPQSIHDGNLLFKRL